CYRAVVSHRALRFSRDSTRWRGLECHNRRLSHFVHVSASTKRRGECIYSDFIAFRECRAGERQSTSAFHNRACDNGHGGRLDSAVHTLYRSGGLLLRSHFGVVPVSHFPWFPGLSHLESAKRT